MPSLYDTRQSFSGDNAGQLRATQIGMAHFAGTGDGRYCGECKYFQKTKMGKGFCQKYRDITGSKASKETFPAKTISCKYIENRS